MFDKAEYINYYNITNPQEELYLEKYLAFSERYLKRHGLILVSQDETEETVSRFSLSQTIYRLPYRIAQENIVEVKGTTQYKTEEVTNYTLFRRVDTDIRSYFELEFEKNYIDITVKGFFGFAEELPPDLDLAFLNVFGALLSLIRKRAQNLANNGQDLSGLKIDEITYNFNQDGRSEFSILDLNRVLNTNKGLKSIIANYV